MTLAIIDGWQALENAKSGDVVLVPVGRTQWGVAQYVEGPTGLELQRITNDDRPATAGNFHVWSNAEEARRYAKRYVDGVTDGQRFRKEVAEHAAGGPIFVGNYKGA